MSTTLQPEPGATPTEVNAGSSAVLAGTGCYAPPRVVTNDDLVARGLDTSDEWIRTRTGIVQRHVADAEVATSDLAVAAGERALANAGIASVDAVVLATTTPDRTIPNTAPEVAARLGLGPIAAFDLNGACAGFVVALATGAGLIATAVAERVLVIGAETMTRVVDAGDRNTAVLFGDGAGAMVLRAGSADERGVIGPFDLGSDGGQADLLEVPAGGSRLPAGAATVEEGQHTLRMDGREVYRRAVHHMVESSRAVLDRAGLTADDVDRFVGHQANARILEAVADRLDIPAERCIVSIDRYGNTSAASLPLALADADVEPGHRVLVTAFGAGLTWASTLLTWPG